jgi:uncharacterized Fe-S radical SAM superfamily protein PflX
MAASSITIDCSINVMGQYHPARRAAEFDELMKT